MTSKKVCLTIILTVIFCAGVLAQNKTDKLPVPIGGIAAIQQNIKYPAEAKAGNIEGKVYIKTLVDKKGNVTNAEIMNKQKIGYGIEEASLNAVKLTKFTPAVKNKKPVECEVVIPIIFRLAAK